MLCPSSTSFGMDYCSFTQFNSIWNTNGRLHWYLVSRRNIMTRHLVKSLIHPISARESSSPHSLLSNHWYLFTFILSFISISFAFIQLHTSQYTLSQKEVTYCISSGFTLSSKNGWIWRLRTVATQLLYWDYTRGLGII